jgi:hypothetical protein
MVVPINLRARLLLLSLWKARKSKIIANFNLNRSWKKLIAQHFTKFHVV